MRKSTFEEEIAHNGFLLYRNVGDSILPQKWQYLVSTSTKKQFGILKDLMNRSDVDIIVNACDAG